jgi:hypothetical protein
MPLPKLPQIQLKPRERLIAAVSGLIVLGTVMDRLVLAPWWAHIRAVQSQTVQMEEELRRAARLLERRERVQAELAPYRRYLRPAVASDELQMASFVKSIEELAGRSQVQLKEIKPLETQVEGATRRYALDVQFDCTMEEWVELLYLLESSSELVELSRAELATQEDVPERLAARLRVVSTAVREEPAAAGGAGVGGPDVAAK